MTLLSINVDSRVSDVFFRYWCSVLKAHIPFVRLVVGFIVAYNICLYNKSATNRTNGVGRQWMNEWANATIPDRQFNTSLLQWPNIVKSTNSD